MSETGLSSASDACMRGSSETEHQIQIIFCHVSTRIQENECNHHRREVQMGRDEKHAGSDVSNMVRFKDDVEGSGIKLFEMEL